MEKCLSITKHNGYSCLVTMQSWMFLSSFEKLRNKLLINNTIINMAHLGARAFEDIGGEVVQTTAFVFDNANIKNYQSNFKRLVAYSSQDAKEEEYLKDDNLYTSSAANFSKIPGSPIAYWCKANIIRFFENCELLGDLIPTKKGMDTGNNDYFIKLWYEINFDKFDCIYHSKKWVPYDKGGNYRKWYGNVEYVVNWENDGFEIKNIRDEKGKLRSRPQNLQYFFRESLTWSKVTIGGFSMRYVPAGAIFDVAGCSLFPHGDYMSMLANMNSCVQRHILSVFSQSVNYEVGQIAALPMIDLADEEGTISELAQECTNLSKEDWDSFENSWNFKKHPLLNGCKTIQAAFDRWKEISDSRFNKMQNIEEEINRRLISIYGLQGEVAPDVNPEEVTVRRADLQREIKSLISYAVGCMFGRYSLDSAGITYAGSGWDDSKYHSYTPDKDGIIPICDDEYFEDDIVGKFVEFIKVAFGEETLEKNLDFIANALGGNGQSRDVIRSYFINDFYADHCATFSVTGSGKRPIYWLFDSGKKNGFKCLIYMHRYQPDTIARIRTDYVHEQQSRYRTAIADLEQRMNGASTSERVKLSKQLAKLQAQAEEIRVYEEKIHHLADQMIKIDLDDGVKHNYELFCDVLAKIK